MKATKAMGAMKVHLIGIGGIGMSAVAQLLLSRRVRVTGSDEQDGPLLQKLRRLGAQVQIGHSPANLNHPDLVVYSSAVGPDNPELLFARNRGIPVLHRGRMLARLVSDRRTIAVAGAHGKSTTTALIAEILLKAGWDPEVAVGAELDSLGGNVHAGRGEYAVVETDESDGSFLWLRPVVAVITNLDEEHLDYFRNRRDIERAYRSFADRVVPDGAVVGCADDPWLMRVLSRAGPRRITCGLSPKAQFRAVDARTGAGGSRYRCLREGRALGTVELRVPGLHNVVNSLAAVAVSDFLGLDFEVTRRALREYRGAKRRFQIHGERRGVLVVEDYGHHPTEIEATLRTARMWDGRRVRCVFQPHRYSRTRYLMDRLAASLARADEVVVLPVYSASEDPVEGATAEALASRVRASGQGRVRAAALEETVGYLRSTAKAGDLVLFLGAGSVGELAGRFLEALRGS